jgi:hypothetical protein
MAPKSIIVFLLSIVLFSCSNKSLQIPLSNIKGETEIYDNSSVWFFKDGDTIYINKGGLISSTNWFFAIEKELPLKLIIPNVKKLQIKKKNNIHAKEGTYNYYIYSDTLAKQNSFFKFNHIDYTFIDTVKKANLSQYVIVKGKGTLTINGKPSTLNKLLKQVDKNKEISLYFNKNTNFQEYLELVLALENANLTINNRHYILN